MVSTTKLPKHVWQYVPGNLNNHAHQGKGPQTETCKKGWLQQPIFQSIFQCFWKFRQQGPAEKLTEGALEQRSVSKNGFSNQSSKAFLAGCLWKFGQASPSRQGPQTETCEEGWLQQPIFQSIFHNVFGSLDNKAQQRSSRKEPSNREV